jgi:hypothetical protein
VLKPGMMIIKNKKNKNKNLQKILSKQFKPEEWIF